MRARRVRRFDKERGCYVYDIGFKDGAEETDRTVKVGEVFGLEGSTRVLFNDFELRLRQGDVAYITGDSGSGKSVLLDALRRDLGEEACVLGELPDPGDVAIVDAVGSSFTDAMELLSRVGLSDARLFMRRFRELSSGQRYRFRLAQMMDSGKQFWLCDEFCSLLDRTTACIVAYSVQKQARRVGATLVVATSHDDLVDLNPDIRVVKGWGEEALVSYEQVTPRPCSVSDEVIVEEGTKRDYDRLSFLHYRRSRLTFPMRYFKLTHRGELVGVIVYKYPLIRTQGRLEAVKYWPTLEELNRDWALICRVIVHPKYRGIGLGSRLIEESLEMQDRDHVELTAVMALYSPFAERAGMRLVRKTTPHVEIQRIVQSLCRLGFDQTKLGSKKHTRGVLMTVDREELVKAFKPLRGGFLVEALTRSKSVTSKKDFRNWLMNQDLDSLAWAIKTLSTMYQSKAYLYWNRGEGGV